jgi:hypothetical protein
VKYAHTQSGWPIRIACGIAALGLVATGALPMDNGPPRFAMIAAALVTAVIGLLWSRMTVRIERERLHWSFGAGWPRFSVALADIAAVDAVRTTFLEGWGVHRTRRGWLYNIAGRDAVLVKRRDGTSFMLGTDEPRRLRSALERAIAHPGERIGV